MPHRKSLQSGDTNAMLKIDTTYCYPHDLQQVKSRIPYSSMGWGYFENRNMVQPKSENQHMSVIDWVGEGRLEREWDRTSSRPGLRYQGEGVVQGAWQCLTRDTRTVHGLCTEILKSKGQQAECEGGSNKRNRNFIWFRYPEMFEQGQFQQQSYTWYGGVAYAISVRLVKANLSVNQRSRVARLDPTHKKGHELD